MKARQKQSHRRSLLRRKRREKERRNERLRAIGARTIYVDAPDEPEPQRPKRLADMTKDEIFAAWMKEPIRGPNERALRVAFIGKRHPK